MDLTDKSQLMGYLKQKGIWAKKGLSQNFLVDRAALDKIVAAAEIEKGDKIIEVGPGVGTLTTELIEKSDSVTSIELDSTLATLLSEQLSERENFNLIEGDVLDTNIGEIVQSDPYKVVANIPYAITSKIIKLFLTLSNKPTSLVMLVQKEVAERICAKPGQMSVLAISVQLYGVPEIVDIVKADSFFPAPKVDSAIIRIRIDNSEEKVVPPSEKNFFRCVKIGFSSKRKKLANNLMSGYHLDRKNVSDIINKIGLEEGVRAQDLTISQWNQLSQLIK